MYEAFVFVSRLNDGRLSANHVNIDGRSAWMILDALFSKLVDEVNGRSPPLSSFVWGDEIKRLPMAPYFIWDVYKHGKPDSLPELESSASHSELEGFVSHS